MSAERAARDGAVDNAAPEPSTPERTEPQIMPFDLRIDLVDRMLNFEIADDPSYTGLEIQAFDDPLHGTGMLVFLSRRDDGRIDVYRQPGLRVDPAGYGIAGGLGAWVETEITPDELLIDDLGVRADVRFADLAGRTIEVRVDDRGRRRRRRATMLAPMGAGIEHPTSLPLVWMSRFDLVRRSGQAPTIRIGGRSVSPGRLPGAWAHRRHLIKYAADLCVVSVNPTRDGVQRHPDAPAPAAVVTSRSADGGIAMVTAAQGTHVARLRLSPPLPNLAALVPSAPAKGTWAIDIDERRAVTGGAWYARRQPTDVELILDVTRPWRPAKLPPLMRLVTIVMPLFRTWPTTYRWSAALALDGTGIMTSRWSRTTTQRGEAYRRMTNSV
jgi:hypothetical protein